MLWSVCEILKRISGTLKQYRNSIGILKARIRAGDEVGDIY